MLRPYIEKMVINTSFGGTIDKRPPNQSVRSGVLHFNFVAVFFFFLRFFILLFSFFNFFGCVQCPLRVLFLVMKREMSCNVFAASEHKPNTVCLHATSIAPCVRLTAWPNKWKTEFVSSV